MTTTHPTTDPTIDPTGVATACFGQLQRAWNRADGGAFAMPFADEMDFVTIRGEHHHGDREVVAAGHQALFDSIYAGSTVAIRVEVARELIPGCIVAVATSTLDAPAGPLRGTNRSRMTTVLTETGGEWRVAAFHNTLVHPGA
jgi:uncharacterized protein (TIGR02246 family)